jgi:hypothetical protein
VIPQKCQPSKFFKTWDLVTRRWMENQLPSKSGVGRAI